MENELQNNLKVNCFVYKLELFKTTRSCEGDGNGVAILNGLDHKWFAYNKDKIIPECGLCFWCAEREWAMKENNIEL